MAIPSDDFRLRMMLAVYSQGQAERIYVEAHGVAERAGKPVLLAGKPLSVSVAKRLARELDKETRAMGHGLLPERVLAASPAGDIAWWCPAGRRHLRLGPDIGLASGLAPLPALLFALRGHALHAFALKTGQRRPREKDRLFLLPLWNNHPDGGMCMGSARFEREGRAAKRIEAAEEAFWGSNFSAHLGGGERVKGGSLKALWAELVGVEGAKFPLGRLLPHGPTLGEYLRQGGF